MTLERLHGYATVTYPQFPLVDNIDTPNSESEEEESYKELDDQVEFPRRFAAPSPEVFKGYRADLPQTPPKLLTPDRKTKIRKNRSTRVPDFVQLLFQIKTEMPGYTIDDPPKHRTRLLLIVEIKKKIHSSCRLYDFHRVLDQTDQQARHAFATHPEVNAFGAIVALGDYWTYREYYREDLRPYLTRSEHSDPTFDSEEPPPLGKIYLDVDRLFSRKGFACLQETESDKALLALRKRLISLGSSMFQ